MNYEEQKSLNSHIHASLNFIFSLTLADAGVERSSCMLRVPGSSSRQVKATGFVVMKSVEMC